MRLAMFKKVDTVIPFKDKVWLSSPTMHGEELKFKLKNYDSIKDKNILKNMILQIKTNICSEVFVFEAYCFSVFKGQGQRFLF